MRAIGSERMARRGDAFAPVHIDRDVVAVELAANRSSCSEYPATALTRPSQVGFVQVSERAPLENGERSGVAAPTRRCRRRPKRAEALIRARPLRSWEDVANIEGMDLGMIDDLKSGGAELG